MIGDGEDEDVELLLGGLDDTDLSPPVLKGAMRLWLGQTTCTVRVAYSADPGPGADLGVGRVLGVLEYADPKLFDRLPRLL